MSTIYRYLIIYPLYTFVVNLYVYDKIRHYLTEDTAIIILVISNGKQPTSSLYVYKKDLRGIRSIY